MKLFISMERYLKNDLEKLIFEENKSYSAIGKIYGVSGNAIKKAAKKLGIILPSKRKINECENFSHPRKPVVIEKESKKRKEDSLVNALDDEDFIKIVNESLSWKEIAERLGYKNSCLSTNVKDAFFDRCASLGLNFNGFKPKVVLDMTKRELFDLRKNWQSARSSIRKLAQQIYLENTETPRCEICGYSNHVEVAHKKAVSEIDGDSTIREINSIDNLIVLCPNHHWEYDNGILEI